MCTEDCPHINAMRAAYLERIRVHKVFLASLRRILISDVPSNEKVREMRSWHKRFAGALTDCVPVNIDLY